MHLSRDVTINSPRAEGSASRMFQRWVGGTVDQQCCRLCQQKCSRATKTSSQLLLLPNWRSYHSCRRDGCHWGGSTVQPWASEGFFPGGDHLGIFPKFFHGGGPKVVKFEFSHSKLRKKLFYWKFQNPLGRPAPPSDVHASNWCWVMFVL